jgi:hypothetical protein
MRLLLKLWYSIVGEPHPDKALKGVNTALANLEAAVAFQTAKAEAMALAAKAAQEASELAAEFAAKSTRIRTRLGEIFEA